MCSYVYIVLGTQGQATTVETAFVPIATINNEERETHSL